MAYQHVIWDFNGTLLDDIDLGVSIINSMLSRRGLATLTKSRYLEIFSFPILDYYKSAGFDLEKFQFAGLADEYISLYNAGFPLCSLHTGAKQTVKKINRAGISQSVLTASSQKDIDKQLEYFGISQYFDRVTGDADHHASGKVKLVKKHMENVDIPRSDIIYIGDTLHDKEVADRIGCRCMLVTFGHQNCERLEKAGAYVVGSFDEIVSNILEKV